MDEFQGNVHLVADVGGTHARFAYIRDVTARLRGVQTYCCADFEQIDIMIETYLSWLRKHTAARPVSLCLAVAAPVTADTVKLTNLDWQFRRDALAARIDMPVTVLNDFAAQAHMLTRLDPDELLWIQRPTGFDDLSNAARLFRTVVGPGTGFGAATLTPAGEVVNSEPGHCSFAPVSEHEVELLRVLWLLDSDRVSNEHLLSGPGLANLFRANARIAGRQASLDAARIVASAQDSESAEHELARAAVNDFIAIAGSVCGDIALASGCRGGLYLSGGMLQKMAGLFDGKLFMARFRAKGPFSDWCAEIPVARLLVEHPGLEGCACFSAARHRLPVSAVSAAQ